MGSFVAEAIGNRDYAVLQGFILMIAFLYVLVNLPDVSYGLIDPRVRCNEPGPGRGDHRGREVGEEGGSLRKDWRGCAATRSLSSGSRSSLLRPGGDLRALDRRTAPPTDPVPASSHRPTSPGRPPSSGSAWTSSAATSSAASCSGPASLLVGVVALLLGMAGGLLLGILAGAFGGKVDTVIMRVVDVMLSIPDC